jgi:DNA repair protein RadA/Sms
MRYQCLSCESEFLGWSGKCPNCGQWGTLEEIPEGMSTQLGGNSKKSLQKSSNTNSSNSDGVNYPLLKLSDKTIENSDKKRFTTGFEEFDRVLGGGVVPGEVILMSGEPGIGKSTLLLQVAGKVAHSNKKVLYVAGEESSAQIKSRFVRMSQDKTMKYADEILITEQTDVASIIAIIEKEAPELVIIDSIQTLSSDQGRGYPGSMSQMRLSAGLLSKAAKHLGTAVFLVGQINKEGLIAGPKIVEHMVDCVVYVEGDQFNVFRLVRSLKNRFGATNEVGVFEMAQNGMNEVTNPSEVFIQEMQEIPGSAIGAILKGSRVVFVEVQALVVERGMESGPLRRVANGIKKPRLDMICAVMSKRGGLFLGDKDVFVNVAGGLSIDDPIIDLAVCAALKSAVSDKAYGRKTVYVGEVGLGGEIRTFYGLKSVIKEAKRLGYKEIVSSDFVRQVKMI